MVESGQESGAPRTPLSMADRHAEIAATRGSIANNAMDIISRCLYVFVGNTMELKAHLESLEDPAVALPATSTDPKHAKTADRYDRELLRLLHNFASSVKSLIDLTRNIVTEVYPDGDLREEYDRRTAAFWANPRRRLVQQLRNYVLHHRLAPTITDQRIGREPDGSWSMTIKIVLDPRPLLRDGDWNAHVRDYLRSVDELDLLELVDEYLDDVAEFHLWLSDTQAVVHRGDIDATNDLIRRHQREVGQPPEWDSPAAPTTD